MYPRKIYTHKSHSRDYFREHFREHFRERPPWWPEDVPWPPPKRRPHHKPFFRRLGCAFLVFNLLMFFLVIAGILFILQNLGLASFSFDTYQWLKPLGIAMLLLFGVGLLLSNLGKRISNPLDDLLAAADRIAEGDYTPRVKEIGPREIRSLARAFNKMAARLNRSNEQRREMLSDITHELRTPLTVLMGNLEGMLDGIYPADEENLRSLLDETHILQRLVEDLRTLALAESGAIQLKKEPTDLAVLVGDTLVSFQSQADAAGVTILWEHGENIPWLELDPGRIRQVLYNLLANALRYTPSGGSIHIRSRLAGSCVELEIQDSGAGIPESDLPHIFERFYKSADSGGMGLGLAIAKHLVEAHNGKIAVESQPGQGTTMRISLPVK